MTDVFIERNCYFTQDQIIKQGDFHSFLHHTAQTEYIICCTMLKTDIEIYL